MKSFLVLSATLGASAYPFVMEEAMRLNAARDAEPEIIQGRSVNIDEIFAQPHLSKRDSTPQEISAAQTNCGPIACTHFDAAEQYVSVSGEHVYMAPAPSDIRGPCPGLNAAANHGYLQRSGVQTISSTVTGLAQAYGFAKDFAAALAVFSSVISGDIVTEQWSIGGPMPYNNIGGLLSPPQGISYTHNEYEGDVSIGRNDAYLNHGDAYSLNVTRWTRAYDYCTDNACTLDKFRQAFLENVYFSIENNPFYFSPPLAGAVVPPAAYNFVINFMSNHSAEVPGGYLDKSTFAMFFGVRGEPGSFEWLPGQEQIPENWYRRPSANPYGAATLVADDVIGWAAYPDGFRLGGNTNGVNTYEGVDLGDLTGGTVTAADITKPNAIGCLAFQAGQQADPDELHGATGSATAILEKAFAPILSQLNCPELKSYDSSLFDQFPGYHYNPRNASNS